MQRLNAERSETRCFVLIIPRERASERTSEREKKRGRGKEEKETAEGCYAGGERTGLKPHQKRDGYIITLAYTIG